MKKKKQYGAYRPTLMDMLSQSSKEALLSVKNSFELKLKKEQENLAWMQLKNQNSSQVRSYR